MSYNNQIIIDIDSETKQDLQKMADKRSVTLSELILGLISDGAILERQRRKQVH
jgi:macrodomain Ter protein organizer (MatP/YcbG family)